MACLRASSAVIWWYWGPSISMISRCSGPAKVGFLARDPLIHHRRRRVGGVEDLEGPGLRVRAAATVGEAGVVVVELVELRSSSAAAMLLEAYCEQIRGGEFQPSGFS